MDRCADVVTSHRWEDWIFKVRREVDGWPSDAMTSSISITYVSKKASAASYRIESANEHASPNSRPSLHPTVATPLRVSTPPKSSSRTFLIAWYEREVLNAHPPFAMIRVWQQVVIFCKPPERPRTVQGDEALRPACASARGMIEDDMA